MPAGRTQQSFFTIAIIRNTKLLIHIHVFICTANERMFAVLNQVIFFSSPLQAQGHPIYLEFCFLWRRVHKMQPCSVHLPPPCLTAAFCGGVTSFKPREGSQKWWCKCISFSFSFRFVLLKKSFLIIRDVNLISTSVGTHMWHFLKSDAVL